jgi:nucleoside-diphosphate-sugar epimerase
MNVLVTGARGFIGRALCSRLASDNKVIGVYHKKRPINPASVVAEKANLTDCDAVAAICKKYSPDVFIHCAGIAHQKIGAVDLATYMRVNSEATENLARDASKSNPAVCFIFLSSVSVYGEGPWITSRPSTICRTYGVNKGAKRIWGQILQFSVSSETHKTLHFSH